MVNKPLKYRIAFEKTKQNPPPPPPVVLIHYMDTLESF